MNRGNNLSLNKGWFKRVFSFFWTWSKLLCWIKWHRSNMSRRRQTKLSLIINTFVAQVKVFFRGFKKRSNLIFSNNFSEIFKFSSLAFLLLYVHSLMLYNDLYFSLWPNHSSTYIPGLYEFLFLCFQSYVLNTRCFLCH